MTSNTQSSQSGQAVVEYILLLSALVSMFVIIAQGVGRLDLAKRLSKPLTTDFAKAYQYGDIKTTGPDDSEGASNHAQAQVPKSDNFRIFLSPGPPR